VTPHHLVFRSKGGGDELENLVSLCTWCHLFGVHAGLIRAEPPASNVRWELGREAILVVEGRTKVAG
jgi:5-methylcytosine-specific restriction endonuclease McrA